MLWMVRSLPSARRTFALFGFSIGSTIAGSMDGSTGDFGGFTGSGSSGSPSHSGSLKCRYAFTKSYTVK
jgi:hypothetical protein